MCARDVKTERRYYGRQPSARKSAPAALLPCRLEVKPRNNGPQTHNNEIDTNSVMQQPGIYDDQDSKNKRYDAPDETNWLKHISFRSLHSKLQSHQQHVSLSPSKHEFQCLFSSSVTPYNIMMMSTTISTTARIVTTLMLVSFPLFQPSLIQHPERDIDTRQPEAG
jgi:hypothetical protein